jgi:hypothetical protein
VNTSITRVSIVAFMLLAGQALGQDQATPTKAPEPTPAPAPQAPAAPSEPVPSIPPAAGPAATAITPDSTSSSFQNKDEVLRWIETYYQNPEPHRVLDAFRTLARENAFGTQNKDFNWNMVGFFWGCMRDNAASMAEWCATIGDLEEPSKTWWWTAVWQAQTDAGNQALLEGIKLPEGHKNKLKYNWLQEKPQDITQVGFRGNGAQHINMLWNAFYATGSERMIYKLYEAFVPAEPKQPTTPVEQELAARRRQRNAEMVVNVRSSFAENLPKHPKALEICRASIDKLKDPVKSQIAALVAEADAAVAAKKAASEPKPDAPAPTDAAPKAEPKAEPTPEPKPEPTTEPATEPKAEPKPEPTPGPR